MSAIPLRKTLVAVLILTGMGVPASGAQTRTDLYGDPLPPGAVMRLGSMRLRLRHMGMKLAFSTDGKTLISFSSRDKTLRHWDPITGRELRRIPLRGAERIKPSGSSDWQGKTVAMWMGETLVVWDASTSRKRHEEKVSGTFF